MNSCQTNFTNGEVNNSNKDAKAGMEVEYCHCQPHCIGLQLLLYGHGLLTNNRAYSSQVRHFKVTIMSKKTDFDTLFGC